MPVPIITPKTDQHFKELFRDEKMNLRALDYPVEFTKQLAQAYYSRIQEYFKHCDRNTVIVPVPSSTRRNPFPVLLAHLIAADYGCTVLPSQLIKLTTIGECKRKLTLARRNEHPVQYEIAAEEINRYTRRRTVLLVDDVLSTGESIIKLQKTLTKANIRVAGLAALVTTERTRPTEHDLIRLHRRLTDNVRLSATGERKLWQAINKVFTDYTRRKVYRVEMSLTEASSPFIIKDILQAAKIERTFDKEIKNNHSLDLCQNFLNHFPSISPSNQLMR